MRVVEILGENRMGGPADGKADRGSACKPGIGPVFARKSGAAGGAKKAGASRSGKVACLVPPALSARHLVGLSLPVRLSQRFRVIIPSQTTHRAKPAIAKMKIFSALIALINRQAFSGAQHHAKVMDEFLLI